MTKNIIATTVLFLFTSAAQAGLYLVEPMVCTGKWNKNPTGYHPSYEQVALKVISFRSVRANDCSLAPSSSTNVEYASADEQLKVDTSLEIMGWYGAPLRKNGNIVSAPFGVSADEIELKIVSSRYVDGQQIDTLVARDNIFKDFHYDLTCEAVVVKEPAHIENNTVNCL